MVYHTPIANSAPVDSHIVNSPMGQIDQAIWSVLQGHNTFTQKRLFPGVGITISPTGSITALYSAYDIDTYASAASDDLDTITPASLTKAVSLLLAITDNARTVTIRHGIGNIALSGGANITLDDTRKSIQLFYNPVIGVWSDVGQVSLPDNPFPIVPWTTLASAAAIDITGISQSYKHLLFIAEWADPPSPPGQWFCQINNVTTSNYGFTSFTYGNTLPVGRVFGNTLTLFNANMVNLSGSNYRAVTRFIIYNYTSTTLYKEIVGYNYTMDSAGTFFEHLKFMVTFRHLPAVNRLQFNPTGQPLGISTKYALFGLV